MKPTKIYLDIKNNFKINFTKIRNVRDFQGINKTKTSAQLNSIVNDALALTSTSALSK